jgi:predicted negative regulator of RcsB-dependent stress response
MDGGNEMSTAHYLLFVAPFVITILVVFGMKYFSAVFQGRARSANDAQYRTLAEKSAGMESELSAIRAELSKLVSSVATVEKILRQVE